MPNPYHRLFILAGVSAAGKTTLLRRAYRGEIDIFGQANRCYFSQSNQSTTEQEYKNFHDAFANHSYFQAIHIPQLQRIQKPAMNPNILIHLDISNVLRRLVDATNVAEITPQTLAQLRIRHLEELQHSQLNDQKLTHYLSQEFFSRFDEVHVATIFCDPFESFRRLSERQGKEKSMPSPQYIGLHNEFYSCWFRCYKPVLSPVSSTLIVSLPDNSVVFTGESTVGRS